VRHKFKTVTSLSIIIPVFNAQATLARALRSLDRIAAKHRNDVEVIVVNDGSTDGSARIARDVQACLPTFEWINLEQHNLGLSAARNAALGAASGERVWFLDADDELLMDPVAETQCQDETSTGFAVEYYRHGNRIRRIAPRLIEPHSSLDVFSAMNPFQPSALIFKRSAVERLFDTGVEIVNDWLFWMENPRIFDHMHARPDCCIARIHIHGTNMSRGYVAAGRNRAEVACRFLKEPRERLTEFQRNNFFIQQQIGLMQQNQRPSPRTFTAWPCDSSLYLKSLVYAMAWRLRRQLTPY
jgi:glycosyltransferase involved in cell wall biosynthesis